MAGFRALPDAGMDSDQRGAPLCGGIVLAARLGETLRRGWPCPHGPRCPHLHHALRSRANACVWCTARAVPAWEQRLPWLLCLTCTLPCVRASMKPLAMFQMARNTTGALMMQMWPSISGKLSWFSTVWWKRERKSGGFEWCCCGRSAGFASSTASERDLAGGRGLSSSLRAKSYGGGSVKPRCILTAILR